MGLLSKRRPAKAAPAARLRTRLDQALVLTTITGFVLLLMVGVVFSVAYGSQEIAHTAASLHAADETLRSATVVRAQIALALQADSVDRRYGTYSGKVIDVSTNEAEGAIVDTRTGVEALTGVESLGAMSSSREFIDLADEVLTLLRNGDGEAAQQLAESDLQPAFDQLTAEIVLVRDGLAAQLGASDVFLGRVGNLARFLVAFLIPSAVILVYRELIRRQHRQAELEARLSAERELGKSREDFIANASHELRTPLTAILGMAMLLDEDMEMNSAEAREMIGLIIGEAGDLSRMVEDLLTTARLNVGALHFSFEDALVAEDIAEVVESVRRSGVDISVNCQPARVRIDRLRFRQVLRNLLSNARKYGGPHVQVAGRVEGAEYVCIVADDGPGIPVELEARLFQRFVHQGGETATKESVGLGLSIVRALVEAMGGSVGYSRIDSETRFAVRLPLVRRASFFEEGERARMVA